MVTAWLTVERWHALLPHRWPAYGLALLIASRLGTIVVAYIGLPDFLSGDNAGYWANIQRMQSGMLPFRDFGSPFETPYNPLFYYVMVIAQTPLQMVMLLSAMEIASFVLIFRLVAQILSEKELKLFGVIYLCSPLALWWSTLAGRQDTWVLVFAAAALLMLVTVHLARRSFWAGATLGVGFFATKLSFIVPLPLIFALAPNKVTFSLGSIVAGLCVLPLLFAMGPNVLAFTSGAVGPGGVTHAAPSIWMLLHGLTGGLIPQASRNYSLLMLLATWAVGLALWVWFSRRDGGRPADCRTIISRFLGSWVLVWVVFSLVTGLGWTYYLMFWLAPLTALCVLQRQQGMVFLAFAWVNLLANVQISVYFRSEVRSYLDLPLNYMYLPLMDVTLLASYVVFGVAAFRYLTQIKGATQ
ncbi:MAG: hypothetical protein MUD01_01520 [Chloroflexaceae bacterium]|nr:hypothetical protein [Chloroflexaceae bacterium]